LSAASSSTRPRRYLLLGHDEAMSEGLLLVCGKVIYSSVAMSSTQSWRYLPLGHDKAESKGLLLGRSDASYSAMTKPSRRLFYSSGDKSFTGPQQSLRLVRGEVFYSSAVRSPTRP